MSLASTSQYYVTVDSQFKDQEKYPLDTNFGVSFQTKNPKDVFYLNLFDDSRFSEEDFYDADHLNDEGALKCSTIVNDYLENPAMDFDNFSDFQAMVEDYKIQLLMEELKEEINS